MLFANTGLNLAALVGIHTVDDAAATMTYLLDQIFATPRLQHDPTSASMLTSHTPTKRHLN